MKSKKSLIKRIGPLFAVFALMLAACGASNDKPALSVDDMLTAAVSTLAASIQQTQTAVAPTNTAAPALTAASTATLTLLPNPTWSASPSATYVYHTPTLSAATFTPSPTGTLFTPTVNPSTLAYGCNNLLFIRDVNYPSGTVVQPRENFTKIWKVANNGTCEWKYQYSLELLSANYPVSGTYKLGKIVAVNDWAELSMNFDAPKNPGTYTSYWRLTDGAGHMFGSTLTASFVVQAPEPSATPVTPSNTPTSTATATATDTPAPSQNLGP
jgi:next-to-BRCA1 protein 1